MGLGVRGLYIDEAHIPLCGISKKLLGGYPFHFIWNLFKSRYFKASEIEAIGYKGPLRPVTYWVKIY